MPSDIKPLSSTRLASALSLGLAVLLPLATSATWVAWAGLARGYNLPQ